MKKKLPKKLTLSKETLLDLKSESLMNAGAGHRAHQDRMDHLPDQLRKLLPPGLLSLATHSGPRALRLAGRIAPDLTSVPRTIAGWATSRFILYAGTPMHVEFQHLGERGRRGALALC